MTVVKGVKNRPDRRLMPSVRKGIHYLKKLGKR